MDRNKDRNKSVSLQARQKGAGGLVFLLVLILIGFTAVMGMRIVPMYMGHFTVRSVLQGLSDDPEIRQMSPAEIRQSIERRFDINNVITVGRQDLKIRRENHNTIIEVDYEVRRPLLGNLEVIGNFNETVVLSFR